MKLPITDSVGNFLNMSVGYDGVVFWCLENTADTSVLKNNIEGEDEPVCLPAITVSDLLQIGTESDGASFNVDEYEGNSYFIVENNFSHSNTPSNANSAYNYSSESSLKHRTVFNLTNTNVQSYDVLMHHQEDYDYENYDNGTLDAYVNVVNLTDYVKERIDKYVNNSFIEMPTATIIWQYVDLSKWYADDDGGTSSSFDGNRPSIPHNNSGEYNVANPDRYQTNNTIQYASKGYNRLFNGETTNEDESNMMVSEIIPLYKRDYVLCDGAQFFMEPSLRTESESINRFLNLFYAIRL